MTTKKLAEEFEAMAAESSHRNGLWKSAYEWTARILRVQHRARAKARLQRMAERYKAMSVSSVFENAANQL